MSPVNHHTSPQLERLWVSMIQSPRETLTELDILIASLSKTAPEYDTAIFYRGNCLIFTGDYQAAIQQLNQALERAIYLEDANHIRRVNNALGMAYKNTGEYGKALQALESAIELSKELHDAYGQLTSQLNLADLFYETQDYGMCEQHINEVTGLDHRNCDVESIAELYWQQARIFLLNMDFDSASIALDRTYDIAVKLNFVHLKLFSLILKGRMFRLMGELTKAEEILENVINNPNLGLEGNMGLSAYVELAKALFSHGNQFKALSVINQALEVNFANNDHGSLRLQVYELAAFCYQAAGDIQKANRFFQLTLELERSVVNQRNLRAMELSKARLQHENQKIKQEIVRKENAHLKNTQNQLKHINNIAIRLAETLSLSALGDRLYNLLNKYLDAHFIALSENDPEQSRVVFRTIIDDGEPLELYDIHYDETDSKTVTAALTGNPFSVYEPSKKRKSIGRSEKQPNSQLFLPLKNKDDVIGVLSIQSEIPERFSGSDYKLILAIAPFISLAFSNALSHEKLQKLNRVLVKDKREIIEAQEKIEFLALHDPLTEMPNRRALSQYIDATISSLEHDKKFSLAYIDLDKFKPVNDQFGHKVGDRVLQIVADRINSVLRSSDFSARVGGDEFVLVIDHLNDKSQLQNLCDRILESIEQPISVDSTIIHISASIGVVEYQTHGINLDTLIHNADLAMYEVKNSSKGGVRLAN